MTFTKKQSKNVDERPHCMSCCYWGLNDPFYCMLLLTTEWSLCCTHFCRDFQCFPMGHTTPKIDTYRYGTSTSSNTWFLGPTRSSPTNRISISSAFLQGSRTSPTDRHADRPHYSVCSNGLYLVIAVMWLNDTIPVFVISRSDV